VQRVTNQFAHGKADTKTAETAVCYTLVTLAKGRHSQVNPEPDIGNNPILNLKETIHKKQQVHRTDLIDLQGFNNTALLVCTPYIPETDLSIIRTREQMAFFSRVP